MWRTVSVVVIIAAPFLIGAYDLIAYRAAGNEATISRVCLDTAQRYPALMVCIGVLFGILLGHLFVPQHVK